MIHVVDFNQVFFIRHLIEKNATTIHADNFLKHQPQTIRFTMIEIPFRNLKLLQF